MKAKKTDRKIIEIPKEHFIIEYEREFTPDEYERLSWGNLPREMEDHWFSYMDNNKIYFHNSWTRECIYILELDKKNNKHKLHINNKQVNVNSKKEQNEVIKYFNMLLNSFIEYFEFCNHKDYSKINFDPKEEEKGYLHIKNTLENLSFKESLKYREKLKKENPINYKWYLLDEEYNY